MKRVLLSLPLIAGLACNEGAGPSVKLSVQSDVHALIVGVGTTMMLPARVVNEAGGTYGDSSVTWTSRNAGTVAITPAGVLTAVDTGFAYVVVTGAGTLDSALISVRLIIFLYE